MFTRLSFLALSGIFLRPGSSDSSSGYDKHSVTEPFSSVKKIELLPCYHALRASWAPTLVYLDRSSSMANHMNVSKRLFQEYIHPYLSSPEYSFIGDPSVPFRGTELSELMTAWSAKDRGTELWKYIYGHIMSKVDASPYFKLVIITDGEDNRSPGDLKGQSGFKVLLDKLKSHRKYPQITVFCVGRKTCEDMGYSKVAQATCGDAFHVTADNLNEIAPLVQWPLRFIARRFWTRLLLPSLLSLLVGTLLAVLLRARAHTRAYSHTGANATRARPSFRGPRFLPLPFEGCLTPQELFDLFDRSKNGTVTRVEFRSALHETHLERTRKARRSLGFDPDTVPSLEDCTAQYDQVNNGQEFNKAQWLKYCYVYQQRFCLRCACMLPLFFVLTLVIVALYAAMDGRQTDVPIMSLVFWKRVLAQ